MPQKPCPTTLCELIVIAALRQKQHKYRNLNRMENAMTLANLKLTTAKKATQLSAVVQRRTKLVKRLAEQIELAKAAQNGSTYAPTKLRRITDAETGERKHVAVAKRVKSWTFNADNGKLCVNVRYGARVLDLGKGKTAVELASTKELVATLETISAAVNAGELDAAMEAASTKLRSAFTK